MSHSMAGGLVWRPSVKDDKRSPLLSHFVDFGETIDDSTLVSHSAVDQSRVLVAMHRGFGETKDATDGKVAMRQPTETDTANCHCRFSECVLCIIELIRVVQSSILEIKAR
mmetsp:Transcript_22573/g.55938  ORF Transcript_22573/g.55938 Transcript_22573/m.55938 type:complete len:111 (-) Transcript_22573:31-363(-)